MNNPRKITLKDVAAKAGFSNCIVSKILNGSKNDIRVGEETRRRVLAAAATLNYKPNLEARRLATGRKDAIGIFLATREDLCSGFFMRAVQGIVARAEELGFTANLGIASSDSNVKLIERRVIDSAIIIPQEAELSENLVSCLMAEGIPHIFVNPGKEVDFNAVYCDDRDGVGKALSYFHSLGHWRIAYFGNPGGHSSVQTRHEAYLDFIARRQLIPFSDPQARMDMRQFISESIHEFKATAILLYHDAHLFRFYNACHSLGLKIPDDLSVIAINDMASPEDFIPQPTVIRIPSYEMGMAGVDLLATVVNGGEPVKSITLKEELVIRESCGERTQP